MEILDGWELTDTAPGAIEHPRELGELRFGPASVPGTAAAAVGVADHDFDGRDWWFRVRFELDSQTLRAAQVLELDGIATISEVYLNDELVLRSESMWRSHRVDVGARVHVGENELAIACRALTPLLRRRRRPAARWRTRVVNEGNLRWFRTMMFGRSPGFAPGPAPVGPWRGVRIAPRAVVGEPVWRPRMEGEDGVLAVSVRAAATIGRAQVRIGDVSTALIDAGDGWWRGELRVPRARRWWPHTHGTPVLHAAELVVDGTVVARRGIGFRSLSFAEDILQDGPRLRINDLELFVRGAVWTPMDLVSLAPTAEELRTVLERLRDAGMNMLRVVGTGAYESEVFHDLCDELGILVWQDLMFANLDYPAEDGEWAAEVQREARQELDRTAGRPSLVVVCGNSEVEQQPAMMGLDPSLGTGPLWEETLRRVVAQSGADCAYVRSTPCGGDLPFHPDRGIVHYFAVSGYFADPGQARRDEVLFAAESLAFANVPDEVEVPVHHPDWKAGVARDAGTGWDLGAGWDFDDVRDHYVESLYRVDSVQLRRSELSRYLDLGRAATGEVMAEVMGEWRREGSGCQGALVLWAKDMAAGAGLGVLDHRGLPKVAYHYLRRALAPVAVWTTDEGVAGVAIHLANDRAEPLRARLSVALYRDWETCVAEAEEELTLEGHASARRTVEGMLGRFVDAAWAYRFGPPAHDVIVVSLRPAGRPEILSEAFRFPAGLPNFREPAARMGLKGVANQVSDGVELALSTDRLAYGVRINAPGFVGDDDAFSIAPGATRRIRLRATRPELTFRSAAVSALNLDSTITVSAS